VLPPGGQTGSAIVARRPNGLVIARITARSRPRAILVSSRTSLPNASPRDPMSRSTIVTACLALAATLGACAAPPTLPEPPLPARGPSLRVPPTDSAATAQRGAPSGIADGNASV
jgi:hypothetical protein